MESVQPASTVSRMKSNSRFEVATEAALRRALVSGVIASVVLAGIIGLILIFTVGVLLGLVVGVVLFVGASAGWMLYVQSAFGDAASSVLEGGGAAAGEDEYPSFRNALEGVAILTGVRVPALRVLDHGSANAMVAQGLEEDATVVVTTGLLENCRIVEAEVLAAELLCRVRDGSARYCTLAAGLPGPVRAAAGLDGGAVAALIGDRSDVGEDGGDLPPRALDPGGVDPHPLAHQGAGERGDERQDAVLPARRPRLGERAKEGRLRENMSVGPAARRRPEVAIEALLERPDLVGDPLGVERGSRRRLGVGPREDLARVADEAAVAGEQRRDRPAAAGAAQRQVVEERQVAVLDEGDLPALEGPARLLAVVGEGDRDEPRGRHRGDCSRRAGACVGRSAPRGAAIPEKE